MVLLHCDRIPDLVMLWKRQELDCATGCDVGEEAIRVITDDFDSVRVSVSVCRWSKIETELSE